MWMLLSLQLVRHMVVVTEKSLWSSQQFFTWSYEALIERGRCKEHGCLPAAGMQEMGWSRFWAPAPALHVSSATGNPGFWTASDAVFIVIKKSWHNLACKGSELGGMHCKPCGCMQQVWDASFDLWSPLLVPSGFVASHLLLQGLSISKQSANVTELS